MNESDGDFDGGPDGCDECGLDDEIDLDRRHENVESPENAASRRSVSIPNEAYTALFAVGLFLAFCMAITSDTTTQHDDSAVWFSLDQTESQLLSVGRHCFSGPVVMGAALQRAFAGIDRYRWRNQQDQLERQERSEAGGGVGGLLGPVEPDHPEAYLRVSKPPRDDDAARCFDIDLPAGGSSHLPFGT